MGWVSAGIALCSGDACPHAAHATLHARVHYAGQACANTLATRRASPRRARACCRGRRRSAACSKGLVKLRLLVPILLLDSIVADCTILLSKTRPVCWVWCHCRCPFLTEPPGCRCCRPSARPNRMFRSRCCTSQCPPRPCSSPPDCCSSAPPVDNTRETGRRHARPARVAAWCHSLDGLRGVSEWMGSRVSVGPEGGRDAITILQTHAFNACEKLPRPRRQSIYRPVTYS